MRSVQVSRSITEQILGACRQDLGFALAGVCDSRPTARERELRSWLGAGRHGEMAYLEKNLEALIDPQKILSGVQSIICVADRYHAGQPEKKVGPGAGRIARYARGGDYHVSMKKRLEQLADELRQQFPNEAFRVCVDTAPLLEREYAARAGLGAIGKHTLLIEQGVGSYLLLGEILTTLEIPPSSVNESDPCGTCTRCIEACPTQAISPWSVDATKCISYLTIEHRSAIDERYHEAMGQWVFGCDICQEVCPHNQPTMRTRSAAVHQDYAAEPARADFDLLQVLNWGDEERRRAFTRSAMKRAKLNMMKRNALIAAGNLLRREENESLQRRIAEIAHSESEDELVRATARAVLDRMDATDQARSATAPLIKRNITAETQRTQRRKKKKRQWNHDDE